MPIFYLMYFAMQKLIYFNQRPLIVVLLISSMLLELNAYGHDAESSLGTYMIKSPESTDGKSDEPLMINLLHETIRHFQRRTVTRFNYNVSLIFRLRSSSSGFDRKTAVPMRGINSSTSTKW